MGPPSRQRPSSDKATSSLGVFQLRNVVAFVLFDPVSREVSPSLIDVKTAPFGAQPLPRNDVPDKNGVLVIVEDPGDPCFDIGERVRENWCTTQTRLGAQR